MDTLDRKILDVVQRNNLLTSDAIAARIGLSASAVQRRLRKLRDSSVIEADVAVVAPEALGRAFMAIVGIVFEVESAQIRRRFAESIRKTPEVMQCYFVTGESTDFFLVVSVQDKDHYNALMSRIVDDFPGIKHYTTSVVLDRVKSGFFVPAIDDNA